MYEIAPVLVIQQGREIAGRPELLARFVQEETLPVGELVADRTLAFGRCVDTLAGQRSARLDVKDRLRRRWEIVVRLARIERHRSKNLRHIDTSLGCVECINMSN